MANGNLRAVNRTIKAYDAEGTLAEVPEALVELCRSLARAVDSEPGNAALFREYRQALDDLRDAASAAPDDDAAEFRISIQTPRGRASVGDTSNS